MKQRIITAVILGACCIPFIIFGKVSLYILCLMACVAAHYEYEKAIKKDKPGTFEYIDIILGAIGFISVYFIPDITLAIFAFALTLVFVTGVIEGSVEEKTDHLVYRAWGFYIPAFLSLGAKVLLYHSDGYMLFLSAVCECMACDIFAYFFGIKFGKHKLCPLVSPKKSVEGSIAGFTFSVITAILFYLFAFTSVSLKDAIILGVLIGIFSQFGDLTASLIKRRFDIKDYGNLLPGHGGVLDRIDAMLFGLCYLGIYFLI